MKRITITLDKRLLEKIDKKRGLIPRSTLIRKLIEIGFEEYQKGNKEWKER